MAGLDGVTNRNVSYSSDSRRVPATVSRRVPRTRPWGVDAGSTWMARAIQWATRMLMPCYAGSRTPKPPKIRSSTCPQDRVAPRATRPL